MENPLVTMADVSNSDEKRKMDIDKAITESPWCYACAACAAYACGAQLALLSTGAMLDAGEIT